MVIEQLIQLFLGNDVLIHAFKSLLLVVHNAILNLCCCGINATGGLQVVPAQPLVAIHGHVLGRLNSIDGEVATVRKATTFQRSHSLFVDSLVPASNLEPLTLLVVGISIELGRFGTIRELTQISEALL